jgi:hypothetical protein
MKVKELLDKLDELTDEEREKWLLKLADRFSPESLGTIMNFQREWVQSDKSQGIQRPFDEFKKAQNKVIRDCVKLEESRIGAHVRVNRGLPRWDMEAELDENPLN